MRPSQKIGVNRQSFRLAFFGVELCGGKVSLCHRARERAAAVFGCSQYYFGLRSIDIIAVDKIKLVAVGNPLQQRLVTFAPEINVVPAHMRNFEFVFEAQSLYLPLENSQTLDVAFLRIFKEGLKAEADAEKRFVGRYPIADYRVETGRFQEFYGVYNTALSGENENGPTALFQSETK